MPYEKNTSEASRVKSIFDNLNNIKLALQDPDKAYGDFQINANGVLLNFMNADGTLNTSKLTTAGKIIDLIQSTTSKSAIQQSAELISLAVFGRADAINQIQIGTEGIQIDGKLLHVTAQTIIDDAFIKKLTATKLLAEEVYGYIGMFHQLVAQNLDVNNLSGNHGEFISLALKGLNEYIRITGDGIGHYRLNGSRSVMNTAIGSEFYGDENYRTGYIGYVKSGDGGNDSLGIVSNSGYDITFGTNATTGTTYNAKLKITNGGIRVYTTLFSGDTGYGINIGTTSVSGVGTGPSLKSTVGSSLTFTSGDVYVSGGGTTYGIIDRLDAINRAQQDNAQKAYDKAVSAYNLAQSAYNLASSKP